MNRLELAEKLRAIAYDVEQGVQPAPVDGVPCYLASSELSVFGDSAGKRLRFDGTDVITAASHSPCRIFDADGNDLGDYVSWANVQTGEHEVVLIVSEFRDALERRFAKGPLRVVIKGEAVPHPGSREALGEHYGGTITLFNGRQIHITKELADDVLAGFRKGQA